METNQEVQIEAALTSETHILLKFPPTVIAVQFIWLLISNESNSFLPDQSVQSRSIGVVDVLHY